MSRGAGQRSLGWGFRAAARHSLLAVALLAVTSVPFGTAASAAAPGALPIADCTATAGVLVAVDFASFGGAVERACVANPATGQAALVEAGFSPAPVTSLSGFFVCSLTDPATGMAEPQSPCVNTPPATAYWTYWHWLPGSPTWTYSSSGAGSYLPCQGSIELWAFGSTSTAAATAALKASLPPPTAIRSSATASTPAPGCPTTSPPPAPPPPAPGTTAPPPATPPATAAPAGPAPAGTAPPTPTTAPAPAPTPTNAAPPGATGGGPPAPTASASLPSAPSPTTAPGPSAAAGPTTVPARAPTATTAPGPPTTHGTTPTPTSSSSRAPSHRRLRGGSVPVDRPFGGRPVRIADVPTSPNRGGHSGSPVALFVGVGLVVILGAGGGILAWRRRRGAQV
ncbi:MAG: hypothetical protein FWC87_11260 [Acidimicrobiaceae bacterium]|nr:hypothetical protein [Acidimicrobiaceae bacterium]